MIKIKTLPFFSPQTRGLKELGPGQFEPTFGLLVYHPHYLFHFSSCEPLPELADNITKGDSEQNADEDSRSYKDFSEVSLLLQNIRITNHVDKHQSVIMLRKFSDLEIL